MLPVQHASIKMLPMQPIRQHSQGVSIHGLNAAAVLQALINAAVWAREASWPLMTYGQAVQWSDTMGSIVVPYYGGQRLDVIIEDGQLSSAGYDAYCAQLRGSSVVEQLRRGDTFYFEPRPMLSRLRSDAAPFVPLPLPAAPNDQIVVTLTPPTPPRQWPTGTASLCVVPCRAELEQRLRPLYDDAWYQHVLVPELMKAAGKTMDATHFVSFYYLVLSLCDDAATDNTLTLHLLEPEHNALINALLPDGAAQAQVTRQMLRLEHLEAMAASHAGAQKGAEGCLVDIAHAPPPDGMSA